jgi:Zn-dependent M28 family amino/carboxypeptidase
VGDRLTEQTVKHAKAPKLVCKLPGDSDSLIIVGAHFDFVDVGHGVVDNWTGCSPLPSLYQSVKSAPRRHTILFVSFTDEEEGMVGSNFYLNALKKQDIPKIRAMVNLDSLGTGPTKVELARGDKQLIDALAITAKTLKLPLGAMSLHAVAASDSDSFQDHKVPAIRVHSLTQETYSIRHTARDRMDAIRLDDYYDTYLLLRSYVAYLDQILDNTVASDTASSAPAVR